MSTVATDLDDGRSPDEQGVPASPSGHSGLRPEPASRLGHSESVPNAFTPGPWFVSSIRTTMDRQRWLRVLQETPERELAFVPYADRPEKLHVEATANARLIAAAPEQHNALAELVELFGNDSEGRPMLRWFSDEEIERRAANGRNALAKARGDA